MRLYTLVVSIAAHAAALVVLVIVPLAAMGALPEIRVVPSYLPVTAVKLPEPPPPPRPRNTPSPSDVSQNVAPTSAPDRIEPEPSTLAGPQYDGPPGVPGGAPGGLPAVGAMALILPPPPTPRAPVRPGGDIQPPTKTKHVAPIYPRIAVDNKVQGRVVLEAIISETGRVRDVRVLRSIPLLDRAALDAGRQWEFTPTKLNGEPVSVLMTVTVLFELK